MGDLIKSMAADGDIIAIGLFYNCVLSLLFKGLSFQGEAIR